MKPQLRSNLALVAAAAIGAIALGVIAGARGEPVSALWLLAAAACCYTIGYRLYARFLGERVLGLDDRRLTPARALENGRDYVPTGRWVVFGHHFAAIAGAGPLVGPILAAQFGYLPGLLWIVVGVVLAGAVQDMVILFGSLRRDGKSLGQMAREEMGPVAGFTALVAVLLIMVILLAVLALVVVKALAESPWGLFTIAMTIPIALLVGVYMRVIRPGKVLEGSLLGAGLLVAALVGGQWVAAHPVLGPMFTWDARTLAVAMVGYGFAASVLPVWLLLAPRDYLSTFVKVGTVLAMAVAVVLAAPAIQMPPLTRFVDGTGPVVAGALFPFCFITIACGAVSGFHALVASGTTPKLVARESDVRLIGYGAMLLESFVAVMALVAACLITPGVYFAVNAPASLTGAGVAAVAQTVTGWGFPVSAAELVGLARAVGEESLLHRTGGAPTFALGMAAILSRVLGGETLMALWYHFAIMFEALFILTTIDAGTRVGRFMLQDLLGHLWRPLGRTSWYPGVLATSAIISLAWGYFLYQGVVDPLGGINSLWPLFGLANQLLAAIALAVGTTLLIKMGKARYAWTTALPLAWVGLVTFTAGLEKVFSGDPRVGFLAHRAMLAGRLAAEGAPPGAGAMMRNDLVNAALALVFMGMAALILGLAFRQWLRILSGRQAPDLRESPATWAEATP